LLLRPLPTSLGRGRRKKIKPLPFRGMLGRGRV